jgi:protein-S-isoprenylcysteine O-methyltransferase Ste14
LTDWALRLLVVYLVFAFGVRVAVSLRTTGKTGISSLAAAPPVELLGGFLFTAGIAAGVASPVLVKHETLDPIGGLEVAGLHAAGFALVGIGIAGTFLAQMQMGASWRIGVDEDERTELITGGLFSLVRNPIYSFMLSAWTGFALMVPTWLAFASVPIGLVGLEIQVRMVEEPHMLRTQGEPYRAWASRVGRFVPGLGRLRPG